MVPIGRLNAADTLPNIDNSRMMGELGWLRGFEPPASWTTTRRSNQLSYSHRYMKADYVVPLPVAVKRSG